MKPLVIYHANCADGFGAAFAAWLKLGDDAEYVPMGYLDSKLNAVEAWEALSAAIPSKANTGREIYILDFSLPKPVMDKLFAISERVVWLDHHKSAFEMWCGEVYKNDNREHWFDPHYGWNNQHHIHLNNYKSGAYLAWEYFHPGTEVPLFIRHIDDYDRWVFAVEGTKAFQKALWSYAPWSFENWRCFFIDRADKEIFQSLLINEGEAILRAHDQNVQSVAKSASRKCTIDMRKRVWNRSLNVIIGLAANCPPHLTSDVGHELATQSGTFGLCWTLSREGLIAKCSLRSNGDYDVSAIAKAFGGGGHLNASGMEVPIETLLSWLK